MKRKLMSVLLVLAMCLTLLPTAALAGESALPGTGGETLLPSGPGENTSGTYYISPSGQTLEVNSENLKTLEIDIENQAAVDEGWYSYTMTSDVTINPLTVSGDVNLILCNGTHTTGNSVVFRKIAGSGTLNIYAGSTGSADVTQPSFQFFGGSGIGEDVQVTLYGGCIPNDDIGLADGGWALGDGFCFSYTDRTDSTAKYSPVRVSTEAADYLTVVRCPGHSYDKSAEDPTGKCEYCGHACPHTGVAGGETCTVCGAIAGGKNPCAATAHSPGQPDGSGSVICQTCRRVLFAEVVKTVGSVSEKRWITDETDLPSALSDKTTQSIKLLTDSAGWNESAKALTLLCPDMTLDLNGHTLTAQTITLGNNETSVKLTIKDSSAGKTGKLALTSVIVTNLGALEITGGTLEATTGNNQTGVTEVYEESISQRTGPGIITVNGSICISGENTKVNCEHIYVRTLYTYQSKYKNGEARIDISGGTVLGGIKLTRLCELNMTGGTVRRNDASSTAERDLVHIRSGCVTISGGTIDYMRIESDSAPDGTDSIQLSGGTFGTIDVNAKYYQTSFTNVLQLLTTEGSAYYAKGEGGTYDKLIGKNSDGTPLLNAATLTDVMVGEHSCTYQPNGSEGNYICGCGRISATRQLEYLDENGQKQTLLNYYALAEGDTISYESASSFQKPDGMDADNTWFAATGTVTIDCLQWKEVNLILCDGATLTVTGDLAAKLGDLTIYAQSTGSQAGKLIVGGKLCSEWYGLTTHGGTITANGGVSSGQTLTLNNTRLTVNGGAEGASAGTHWGVLCQELKINNSELTAAIPVKNGAAQLGGIGVRQHLTMNGGKIEVKAPKAAWTPQDASVEEYGLNCSGNLTLNTGTIRVELGTVNVTKAQQGVTIDAVYAGSITINGGSLTAVGGTVTATDAGIDYETLLCSEYGVFVAESGGGGQFGNILVNGGQLKVIGGKMSANSGSLMQSIGIRSGKNITVHDGEVSVTSASGTNFMSCGILALKSLLVDGGKVKVSGGEITADTGRVAYGLNCTLVQQDGGSVDIQAPVITVKNKEEAVDACSYGAYIEEDYEDPDSGSGSLTLLSGTLKIYGGRVNIDGAVNGESLSAASSKGVYAQNLVCIRGGKADIRGADMGDCSEMVALQNAGILTGTVSISGGDVTVMSGKAAFDEENEWMESCMAITANDRFEMSGGKATVVGGASPTSSEFIGFGDFTLSGGTLKSDREDGALRVIVNGAGQMFVGVDTFRLCVGSMMGSSITAGDGVKLTDIPQEGSFYHILDDEGNSCAVAAAELEELTRLTGSCVYLDVCAEHQYESGKCIYCGEAKPSSGGGGGGSSAGSVTIGSSTFANGDGSVTKTETKLNGTVVDTTTYPDGSTVQVEKRTNGTVVTTSTSASGAVSVVTTDKDGAVTSISAKIPASAVENGAASLPGQITAAANSESAAKLAVSVPEGGAAVSIPVANVTPGTVVIIVNADGTETVIPTTRLTENGIVVTLEADATVKIVNAAQSFDDVPAEAYYADAVAWASARGITGGTDASHFTPGADSRRGQLITFLWRAAGCPSANGAASFTDVLPGKYYSEAVRWAAQQNIVNGYQDGSLGVDDTVTREQMAVILFRFARAMNMDTTQGGMAVREFADYESVSGYAREAMQWAVNAGVLKGNNGALQPQGTCTRGQLVTMLYRLLGR